MERPENLSKWPYVPRPPVPLPLTPFTPVTIEELMRLLTDIRARLDAIEKRLIRIEEGLAKLTKKGQD